MEELFDVTELVQKLKKNKKSNGIKKVYHVSNTGKLEVVNNVLDRTHRVAWEA